MQSGNPFPFDQVAQAARYVRLFRRNVMHHSIAAVLLAATATGLGTNGASAHPVNGLTADSIHAAGINVLREKNDGSYSDVWLKKPVCMVSCGETRTPDVMYTLAYKNNPAWNESRWTDERFNELILRAKAHLTKDLRNETYREMAIPARNDGGALIPFFNDE